LLDDIEMSGELPREPRPMGRLLRVLERWRGDTKGRLRAAHQLLDIPAGWKVAKRSDTVDFERGLLVIMDLSDKGLRRPAKVARLMQGEVVRHELSDVYLI
jgi:hypothetical protein